MYAYLCATNHQIYICYVTAILQTFKYAKKKQKQKKQKTKKTKKQPTDLNLYTCTSDFKVFF